MHFQKILVNNKVKGIVSVVRNDAFIFSNKKNVTIFNTFVTICNFFRFSQKNCQFLPESNLMKL
jgi:hypothetical protein